MIMRGIKIEEMTMQDLLAYRDHILTAVYNKYKDQKEKERREAYMRVQIHEQCDSINNLRNQVKSGEAKIRRMAKTSNMNKKN